MTEVNYSQLSRSLTKNISKNDKKTNGIYFTPPKTIKTNLELLAPYMPNVTTVLEPSCGSCEYLLALDSLYEGKNITGIEFNQTIYDSISSLAKTNIQIQQGDYLLHDESKKYDLIIGNPPYFVMKKKEVDPKYHKYFDGRPNIFILFIIKALKSLNNGGILSFVLPKNFLNCLYYDKTRNYILQKFKILHILECNDDYLETSQSTVIIVVQKSSDVVNNTSYILDNINYTIFGTLDSIAKLKLLRANSTTLAAENFTVSVGNVVWNQCKAILTDDVTKTRLIYSSDIKNHKLGIQTYKNIAKKNYIDKTGTNKPLLVVNRGYGVGNYKFEYCLIEGGFEYLIENHLICIKYTQDIEDEALKTMYTKIIASLKNKKTQDFISLYFGNNAINTKELSEILPIYQF